MAIGQYRPYFFASPMTPFSVSIWFDGRSYLNRGRLFGDLHREAVAALLPGRQSDAVDFRIGKSLVLCPDAVLSGQDVLKRIVPRGVGLHHAVRILIDAVQRNLCIRYCSARGILGIPSNAAERGLRRPQEGCS